MSYLNKLLLAALVLLAVPLAANADLPGQAPGLPACAV